MARDNEKALIGSGTSDSVMPPTTDVTTKPPEQDQQEVQDNKDFIEDVVGPDVLEDVVEDSIKDQESLYDSSEDPDVTTSEDKEVTTSEDKEVVTSEDSLSATSEDTAPISEKEKDEQEGLSRAARKLRKALKDDEQVDLANPDEPDDE